MTNRPQYGDLASVVGNTPLVRLSRVAAPTSYVLAKLEGNNPAGSVKDRPAFSMLEAAEASGQVTEGSLLIEATSGNTGIGLAMAAAVKGYPIIIVLPEGSSKERISTMRAFGAEVILSPEAGGMEGARDLAEQLTIERGAIRLDQFANLNNPRAHYLGTGPEIWQQTAGTITHFVSAMGTTGTITGVSRYLKEQSADVQIVGVHPEEGSKIPGIRRWPKEYLPTIYDPTHIDEVRQVSRERAVFVTKELARREGLFVGISTGGAAAIALDIAEQHPGATVVFIACDRGDRYLSTGVFDD